MTGFEHLLFVVKTLRSKDGCPWDRAQTPLSLRKYLIEETFEAVDAISEGDALHAKEELGDVFFNVLLDAFIYEEQGDFSVDECLHEIAEKLERRHPHVFGEKRKKIVDDLDAQWENIKAKEGRAETCAFSSIPDGFPPILKASKIVSKAAKKGFSWKSAEESRAKILEEFSELDDALLKAESESNSKKLKIEEEYGDLLFAVCAYGYYIQQDPSAALLCAISKFKKRFEFVENALFLEGKTMSESNRARMKELWNESKKIDR